jgi:YbgC/YbaW family acyl-CoA thioester hydrolase
MSNPFRTSRRVEFADTDMAGIVHFANFFRYMEAAEVDFLQSRGLSVRLDWEGQAIGFPRVSASCDFLRPVRFLDILDIAVSVSNVGRKSVTYTFEFSCRDVVIARGEVSACCCRIVPGHGLESVEIPPTLRQMLSDDSPGNS